MNNEEVLAIFRQSGAYLNGHFRLTSGLHSDSYMQCALVLQYPHLAEQLAKQLAVRFAEKVGDLKVDTVIGPAMGGVVIAQELARVLGCRSMFMERVEGKFTLRRGFSLNKGEKILLCEDVVTTGGSVREVADSLVADGHTVLGICSLVDRSGGKVEFSVPFIPLMSLTIPAWQPDACPLCASGTPLYTPGSKGTS